MPARKKSSGGGRGIGDYTRGIRERAASNVTPTQRGRNDASTRRMNTVSHGQADPGPFRRGRSLAPRGRPTGRARPR